MRLWVRIVSANRDALADALQHLEELARSEDSVAKASTIEQLYYQRGKVDGLRTIASLLAAK